MFSTLSPVSFTLVWLYSCLLYLLQQITLPEKGIMIIIIVVHVQAEPLHVIYFTRL